MARMRMRKTISAAEVLLERISAFSAVTAGHSRLKDGVASLAYVPAIPLRRAACLPKRDARHKAGHDGEDKAYNLKSSYSTGVGPPPLYFPSPGLLPAAARRCFASSITSGASGPLPA